MSEDPSVHTDTQVYSGAGQGVFAGLLAAAAAHWLWGLNLFLMAFWYGFSMATLRGWAELAGILTMIGTPVLYFAIYDAIALDSAGLGLTIGLCVLAFVLFAAYVATVAGLTNRARLRALQDTNTMAIDVERTQHWEEKYFALLRAKRAADTSPTPLFIRPFALTVLGFGVAVWSDSRLVDSLAWGVAFFQLIVIGRMVQYLRRLRQPRGETVLARAERRPILFLRPFALDALPVSPIGEEWHSVLNPYAWLDKRTFEEHLSSTFEDLGPVIAIGRPGEEVPLLGAAREYADEGSWQALVLERAAQSQFVIMEVDATPGMVWEIDHVSKLVGLQRIVMVLPPGDDQFEKRPATWYQRWAALQSQLRFLPDVSEDTAAVLYDRAEHPVLVVSEKSSVPRTLARIKSAWLRERGQPGMVA